MEPVELIFSTFAGEGHPFYDYNQGFFLDLIEERTPITWERHLNSSLLGQKETMDAIKLGIIHAGEAGFAHHPTRFPLSAIAGLPWLSADYNSGWKAAAEVFMNSPEITAEFLKENVVPMGVAVPSPRAIFSMVPLNSPADFRGKKFRGVANESAIYEYFGATGIPMSLADATVGMKTGVVQGQSQPWWAGVQFGLPELVTNVSEIGYAVMTVSSMGFHQPTFESFPDPVKKAILDSALETVLHFHLSQEDLDRDAKQVYIDAGVPIVTFTEEQIAEMRDLVAPMYDEYLESDPTAQIVFEAWETAVSFYKNNPDALPSR
jgi:TRAP-type C4-dicarboxylate transport system substrate-binding protein